MNQSNFTAKFRNTNSFEKQHSNYLSSNNSNIYLNPANINQENTLSKKNSFDFSYQLMALNLQVVNISENNVPHRFQHPQDFIKRKKLNSLVFSILKQLQFLRTNLKDLQNTCCQLKSQSIFFELMRKTAENKFQANFIKNNFDKGYLVQEELQKQIEVLKQDKIFRDQQIKLLKLELNNSKIQFEKKQNLIQKQLQEKELNWKKKIDQIIIENREQSLKSSQFQSNDYSVVFGGKTFTKNKKHTSAVTSTRINRYQKVNTSYKTLKSRIKNIQNLIKSDLLFFQ